MWNTVTDDPLLAGVTPIKAIHIAELRVRIDALRGRYGLTTFPYANASISAGVSLFRVIDFIEMRQALVEAYNAAARTAPHFTTTPAVGVSIGAADLIDLRADVKALE